MKRPVFAILSMLALLGAAACEQAQTPPSPAAAADGIGSGFVALVLFLFAATLLILLAVVAFLSVFNFMELRKLNERLNGFERAAAGRTPQPAPPAASAAPPTPAFAASATLPVSASSLDSKTLTLVITSAVAAALHGRSFRIRRIHLADHPSLSWSQLGRERIHASHAVEVHH